jgi:hypothetical protein
MVCPLVEQGSRTLKARTLGSKGNAYPVCLFPNAILSMLMIPCSCLAHIINLATQAFLATYSKAPHYDPATEGGGVDVAVADEDDDADEDEDGRDVIGLIRSITVKVRLLFTSRPRSFGKCTHSMLVVDALIRQAASTVSGHPSQGGRCIIAPSEGSAPRHESQVVFDLYHASTGSFPSRRTSPFVPGHPSLP